MRKQTKLVAVLSTAALLAVGASMTSFAAQGWAEENGTWVYYDKSGNLETEKWEKSGDNWFYLSDDGEMATDELIETSNSYYYVDENGAMVTNKWITIENDDYDGSDDEPSEWWYYFQGNGKAMKGSNNNSINLKTVNGKKYVFDEEGKMLYGWVNKNGERETGDDAWQNGEYYFGDENDGSMATGWKLLNIYDDNAGDSESDNDHYDTAYDDEDQDRYFYFLSNGKKVAATDTVKEKTINGKKYAFDGYGRMLAEWSLNAKEASVSTSKKATGSAAAVATLTQTSRRYKYYNSPEDGARITKGWFQVVPDYGLNSGKFNDNEEKWFYSDKDGKLVANEIKTINGKKYAFDEKGSMVDGLKFISVLKNDKNKIIQVHDGDFYDTEEKFDAYANGDASYYKAGETVPNFDRSQTDDLDYITYSYFFGAGSDGSMKTGKQNVTIDGDDFGFLFDKSGGVKGTGKLGEDSDKYYLNGKLVKADKEDKYSVIQIQWDKPVSSYKGQGNITGIKLLTTDQFVGDLGNTLTAPTTATANGKNVEQKKDNAYYNFPNNGVASEDGKTYTYHLVNTSGTVETKNKTKAKDGNDICYEVKDGLIVAVYEEK